MTYSEENPIGTAGQAWREEERAQWLALQVTKRSYRADVVSKIEALRDRFDVEQYGNLDYASGPYPLFAIKSRDWSTTKPTVLVTGGVHGYETSGVHGALSFLEQSAFSFANDFNLLVAPCVSPWGYETINRWNPLAIDPNRSFTDSSAASLKKAGESSALRSYVKGLNVSLLAHIDLHETTDTDNSEFRPALAARDGTTHDCWNIPDGFYLVGNEDKPVPEFQRAVLDKVEAVTHIAEADGEGKLIGTPLAQFGVVNYATTKLGLCIGFSDADYATTTEVYPDSPRATPQQCVDAQVAAIVGGLEFLRAR